ncbi:MAG: zinc-binding dehydrogenase [Simkaniaceae bacterium]|nr:zinc-binding dehydrogenase [Simkaniaceae bacterium]
MKGGIDKYPQFFHAGLMQETKAAVLRKLNAPLDLCQLMVPELKQGQVLVKLAFSGLCRSQLNEIKGFKGTDSYLPHTLGHEGSGTVVKLGSNVSKVKVGDHVILTWIKGEGHEVASTKYLCQGEIVNSGAISTFSEYAVISENRLIRIPFSIPLDEAALFGCAIPTGAGILMNDLKVSPGKSIAILGMGGIGLSALLAAKAFNLHPIIAIDIEEAKLDLAKQLGATECISTRDEKNLSAYTNCLDYAIESAGVKSAMEKAFSLVKPSSGIAVIAGNLPRGSCIELDPFDFILGKKLIGTWGGGIQPDKDIPQLMEAFTKQNISVKPLISHEFPLMEINQAIKLLEERQATRILITL